MKNKMKKFSIILASVFGLMTLVTSCNDEWTQEQYEHFVSFKAPLDDKGGVSSIYVPYTRLNADRTAPLYGVGVSDYKLPLIVSGTTKNDRDFTVSVGHDTDTLSVLNYAWFQNRTDLYYKDFSDYADYPGSVNFKSGDDIALLNVKFNFAGVDMVEKWVLPIMIKDDGVSPYQSHPRKHYGKALLRVYPYNSYSGNYSAVTLLVKQSPDKESLPSASGSGQEVARGYVVDEDEIFFYAGTIDESRTDRKNYKVYCRFIPNVDETGSVDENAGVVELYSKNPDMQFETDGKATYTIYEKADDIKPYLKHRYVIISDINYTFADYTLVKNRVMWYNATGSLTHERQINTQIPDDDAAIDW